MIPWKPKKRICKAPECGQRFVAEKPIVWWCSPDCGAKVALQKLAKKRISQDREFRKRTAILKRSVKPRKKLLSETQTAFNWFIRERDFEKPCVSCGRPNDGQHQRHAGHYKTVGSSPALRFDEDNCHAQCSVCNNHLSGNLVEYRKALEVRIGIEAIERLEGPQDPKKPSTEELEGIKKHYNREARLLNKKRLENN